MVEARDRRGTGTKASTQSGQTTVNGPLNPISGSDTRVIAAVRPGAARREWSGSKQSKGHYRDAVLAAVGVCSSVHHDCIEKFVSELVFEPGEVFNMGWPDGTAQFRFNGNDLAARPDHDEVHLVIAAPRA